MKITKVTEDAVATLLDDLLKRSPNNYTGYADKVQAIIDDVRERGDEALFEMTKRFDGADLNADNIRVTQAEIDEAYTLVTMRSSVSTDGLIRHRMERFSDRR